MSAKCYNYKHNLRASLTQKMASALNLAALQVVPVAPESKEAKETEDMLIESALICLKYCLILPRATESYAFLVAGHQGLSAYDPTYVGWYSSNTRLPT